MMTQDHAWWAAMVAALCTPSLPRLVWKGFKAMQALFPSILKILALLGTLISVAEAALGPGTGEQKKARVIADLQAQLPVLASQLGVAGWLVDLFSHEGFLAFLIDSLVAAANGSGHLGAETIGNAAPND